MMRSTVDTGAFVITESDFPGAGEPRPDLPPERIPELLYTALANNDFPSVDAGLQAMWKFSSDTTRHIFEHNVTDFIESAHETAREFPTSLYGCAFFGQSWEMETELNRVGCTSDDDDDIDDDGSRSGSSCWIATQVMKTVSSDGRVRRWQWELRKRRRPPDMNCWYVESVASSDRKGQFEAE